VPNKYLKRIKPLITLIPEEQMEETYNEILGGSQLRGHNFWILGFAMIIACIGLDTNSTSATIGAMLISPLIGPIVGFSAGLALNDIPLKKSGIKNWFWMTIISLLASVFYFVISPYSFHTAQLDSFTKATIFDIVLAFFGGMAGYVGLVKKDGVKVLAGVACATACMPPLCTSGYGIAHGEWHYALGGLYFYLINCLFIGLATFLLSRFNKLHIKTTHLPVTNQLKQWLWILFIIAMMVPGVYLAYTKWEDQKSELRKPSLEERIKALEEKVK
jgi:uncharacterized hydrophobic protein (TIGR00271 family)